MNNKMNRIIFINILVLSVSACTDFSMKYKPSPFSDKRFTTPFTPYEEAVKNYNRHSQPFNNSTAPNWMKKYDR
jgi:hypothetical protein